MATKWTRSPVWCVTLARSDAVRGATIWRHNFTRLNLLLKLLFRIYCSWGHSGRRCLSNANWFEQKVVHVVVHASPTHHVRQKIDLFLASPTRRVRQEKINLFLASPTRHVRQEKLSLFLALPYANQAKLLLIVCKLVTISTYGSVCRTHHS